jgi:hypothetical protein
MAAELVGLDPQSLRLYEQRGLLEPDRTEGGTRRYSADGLDWLRRISRRPVTSDLTIPACGWRFGDPADDCEDREEHDAQVGVADGDEVGGREERHRANADSAGPAAGDGSDPGEAGRDQHRREGGEQQPRCARVVGWRPSGVGDTQADELARAARDCAA